MTRLVDLKKCYSAQITVNTVTALIFSPFKCLQCKITGARSNKLFFCAKDNNISYGKSLNENILRKSALFSLHFIYLVSVFVVYQTENPKTEELRVKKQDVTLIVVHKASSETYASSIGTAVPFTCTH